MAVTGAVAVAVMVYILFPLFYMPEAPFPTAVTGAVAVAVMVYILFPLFDMPEAPFALPYRVEDIEEEEEVITPEETASTSRETFEALNLFGVLLKNVYAKMEYHKPTKLQSLSLRMIPNQNQFCVAYSASGKTTCIVMGSLRSADPELHVPQVLCLAPTKELAKQIWDLFLKMGEHTGIKAELSFPNEAVHVPMTAQVIVGTVATVYYLIADKKLCTSGLKTLMFDDVDHMLIEGGCKEGSVRIMKDIYQKNPECKVVLYATIHNDYVKSFVKEIVNAGKLEECSTLFVKKDGPERNLVKQYKVKVPDQRSKIDFTKRILVAGNYNQAIIFVTTNEIAGTLYTELVNDHNCRLNVTNYLAPVTQQDKDSVYKEFEGGWTQVIIADDSLARGSDSAKVNLGINFDLPEASGSTYKDCEQHLYRGGRVGRGHNKGVVFNLLCGDADNNLMEKIANYNNEDIEEVTLPIEDEVLERMLERNLSVFR